MTAPLPVIAAVHVGPMNTTRYSRGAHVYTVRTDAVGVYDIIGAASTSTVYASTRCAELRMR
jgi:hypothetical protein